MSSESRPWFKFWMRDFYGAHAVRIMSAESQALYVRLLAEEWEAGGPIPHDLEFWRKVHGSQYQDFDAAWAEVEPCFEVGPNGMFNKRLEAEREEAVSARRKRSASASHAARMRHASASDAKREREIEKKKKKSTRTRKARTAAKPKKEDPGLPDRRLAMEHWLSRWQQTRPAEYKPVAKDWAALKKCFGMAEGALEEVKLRIDHLLMHSEDRWLAENASLSLLASKWNQLSYIHGKSKGRASRGSQVDAAFSEVEGELNGQA